MTTPIFPPQQSDDQPPIDAPVGDRGSKLAGWIMERVTPWRNTRDQEYRKKWDEFQRIWRGEWSAEDKNKKTERSRIVCPATMQAVDSTCSEIDEALFRREAWFDIDEDIDEFSSKEEREPMLVARDRLLELCDEEKVPDAVSRMILIGAIYGTGVGKVNTYVKSLPSYQIDEKTGKRSISYRDEMRAGLVPLEPYEFVPDPTTDILEEMLGAAHETIVPLHEVQEGMEDGRYRKVKVGTWSPQASDPDAKTSGLYKYESPLQEGVKITEWQGKVPASHLAAYLYPEDARLQLLMNAPEEGEDDPLVEAIVTLANEATVIGAKPNPFMMEDRSFIAFQFDTVPGIFWGRGIPEKAYNAQKALDASVRARIDSLALVANPMLAGDITRLPRGMSLAVWPGKFWPTTGSPNEVIQPFSFGAVNPDLFPNAQDMERMVQTATGAMDPGAGYSEATGAQDRAMMGSAFIKRSRRTVQNVERNLMRPLVQKLMWRYVQFHPEFPQDFKFTVRGTLGVMAREVEAQQQTQMLSLVPNESRPFMAMLKNVFDNTAGPRKNEVIKAIDSMLNPSDEEKAQQQKQQQLQERSMLAEIGEREAKAAEAQAKAREALAKAVLAEAQAKMAPLEVATEMAKVQNDQREVAAFEDQNAISEAGLNYKSVDLALRAAKLPAEISEIEANAAKLRADANRPISKSK